MPLGFETVQILGVLLPNCERVQSKLCISQGPEFSGTCVCVYIHVYNTKCVMYMYV